jgi:16S rRNA (cytosine1402-N4)-methyltransferase
LLLEKYKEVRLIAVDRDKNILSKAKENLKDYLDRVEFVLSSYGKLENILKSKVDIILLDLGVNMEHFKDASRGFSIKKNGPLDMRFDQSQKITAEYILKNYSQSKLEEILTKWGDFK